MEWYEWLRVVSLGVGGAAALGVAGRVALSAYDAVHARWVGHRQSLLTLRDIEQQTKLRDVKAFYPDERGRLPLLYGLDGVLRDANSLRAFTLKTVLDVYPRLEQLDAVVRAVTAGGGWPAAGMAERLLEGPEVQASELPTRVPLRSLLEGGASFRRVVLGVAVGAGGRREVVTADMGKLVHVAVGGSSGWGKSAFLRALGFQLATSRDLVELAMIDLEGATLAPFAGCERLLWPVADREVDARAILDELTRELDRRRALFAEYPGVDSLDRYNERSDEPLAPLVCLIDEATALLDDKECERRVRTLALRARKCGVWVVLAGQDWKATSLDSAIRNQLATRVQFKAMSDSQSRVLLQRAGAEAFEVKGRALAWIPGRDLVTLQAPWIGYEDIMAAMSGGGPRGGMPQGAGGTLYQVQDGAPAVRDRVYGFSAEERARIWELHEGGASDTAIASELRHGNMHYIQKVRAVLRQQQQGEVGE